MSEIDILAVHGQGNGGEPPARGIWSSTTWGGHSGENAAFRNDSLPPYEPKFDDSIERRITIDIRSSNYKKFFTHESKLLADVISLGTIKFDIELERVKVDHDDHKDLIVHVACNRDGLDPIWRCSFQCEITASFGDVNATATGLKKDARNKDNSLTMPVMRLSSEPVEEASLFVIIKMNKWKGIYPRLVHDFTQQNQYTNATLIVEDTPLYVTREILAMHSAYFNTMFFSDNFTDASKTEFNFPDVSYADMLLLLNLTYPETMVGRREKYITSLDDIERMLQLSEQFTVPSLKYLAERMLKGAPSEDAFPNVSWTRILYIADRFRLSDACSAQMKRLRSESDFVKLRHSEEFEQLSARLRSSLLTTALEKLPASTTTCKKQMPSRTGRIGAFSDVEVDDDEDDKNDIAVIGTVNPVPRTVAPANASSNATQGCRFGTTANTNNNSQRDPHISSASTSANTNTALTLRPIILHSGNAAASSQPAAASSSSAPTTSSSSANAVASAAVVRSAAPLTSALAAIASLHAAPVGPSQRAPFTFRPTMTSSSGNTRSPGYEHRLSGYLRSLQRDASPLFAMRKPSGEVPPSRQDKDIKEEVISSDEMDRDDEPGPSNRPCKRTTNAGVITRSRSKKPKNE